MNALNSPVTAWFVRYAAALLAVGVTGVEVVGVRMLADPGPPMHTPMVVLPRVEVAAPKASAARPAATPIAVRDDGEACSC